MASKPKKGGDSAADDALKNHPAYKLLMALHGLSCTFSSTSLFRDIAQSRARRQSIRAHNLDAFMEIANERMNERIRAGEPIRDVIDEAIEATTDPIKPSVPPAYAQGAKDICQRGLDSCERVRDALQEGGAKVMDAYLAPNTAGQPRSIELHTNLSGADEVFGMLMLCMDDPGFSMDDAVQKMGELGDWFAPFLTEFRAVLELHGLDAPEATNTAPTAQQHDSAEHVGEDRRPVPKPDGWTKSDLVRQAKEARGSFSNSTFDNIRKDAGVSSSPRGGKGQQRQFTRAELKKLIAAVEAGTRQKKDVIAAAWRELLQT